MFQVNMPLEGAIQLALLLLPGFVALRVRDGITRIGPRAVRDAWIPALIFDLVVYVILLFLATVPRSHLTPTLLGGQLNPVTILVALAVAVTVGFFVGLVEERGWFQGLMWRCGISRKGCKNVWDDAFRVSDGCWANVRLADGTQILGWPRFSSGGNFPPAVFLARGEANNEPALVRFPGETRAVPVLGPGVLVTPSAGIVLVEFLDSVVDQGPRAVPEA